MVTLKDELNGLKADFVSLQNFLKEKITSIEFKINDIENKMCVEYFASKNEVVSSSTIVQELDNQTRNIVEELMWESTLSQSALRVRELFKDSNAREKFLRCCLELVLEKDEQYRKMAGTLFGHLISQNIINQTNLFNSLSPVLLVIENSNNYNTKMWCNLTEILLPMIMDSHIKLLQVQRKAQTILKQEYYREFLDHLCCAVESSRKHKFKPKSMEALTTPLAQSTTFVAPATVGGAIACDKRDFSAELADECAGDLQNLYDVESMSKFKPCFDNLPLDDPRPPKYDIEGLVNNLAPNNVDEAVKQLRLVEMAELKTAIEELIDQGVQKEPEQRLLIGSVLASAVGAKVFDGKLVVIAACKSIFKVQRLIVNQNTRVSTCAAFVDMLLPLFGEHHLKFGQLSAVASMALPEETKTIFLWFMERALNEKGLSEATSTMQPSAVTVKLMKRMRKFMGKSAAAPRTDDEQEEIGDALTISDSKAVAAAAAMVPRGRLSPMRSERRDLMRQYAAPAAAQSSALAAPPAKHKPDVGVEDQSEHEKFLNLKRQKLLKERIENAGDKMDVKIDDLLNDPNKKLQDGDLGGDPQLRADVQKAEGEQAPTKQPENLPSSAIKEKMQEIIEHLMETGNLEECVSTVKETFNECQTDLVFKAAFEYTKDKSSEYRVQSGRLVSEAFKHDPRRIGSQIMNTISLELGDFVDVPELWNGMAEIICPPMLNGLIRFVDLKLLPKYFLHTNHCASLLLAIFKQIVEQSNVEWLEENWKKSKLELTTFLPLGSIHKFLTDNKLEFLVKDDQMAQYKENAT